MQSSLKRRKDKWVSCAWNFSGTVYSNKIKIQPGLRIGGRHSAYTL